MFPGSAGVCGRRVCGDAAVSDAVLSGADAGGDESVGRWDPDLGKLLQRVLQRLRDAQRGSKQTLQRHAGPQHPHIHRRTARSLSCFTSVLDAH